MGLLSFLLGIFGFGIGIPIGFLIAFFIFVHSEATEITVNIFSTLSFTPPFFFYNLLCFIVLSFCGHMHVNTLNDHLFDIYVFV